MTNSLFASRAVRAAIVAAGLPWALASAPVDAAADESGVGIVAEYRPAAARFTLTRRPDGAVVPVRIGTVVKAGDRIELKGRDTIIVQLANGKSRSFDGPGTYEVEDSGPLNQLVSAVLDSMSGVFDDEYRLEGTAASRGGEPCTAAGEAVRAIEVPILVPGASVVAGERDLPLAWRGGCAPFVVSVLAGGQSLVDRESIEGRQLRLDDVPLVPGSYTILITDAGERRFTATLEATTSGPALPAELAADSSPLGVVAQAVWLADQDGGRWRLESFEKLRPLIRAGDPLAGTIGDGVLWGSAGR